MQYHSLCVEDTIKELGSDRQNGLSSKEAIKREKQYGENRLLEAKKKSVVSRFFSQFGDFMILILIFAAGVSFALSLLEGHADYVDPVIIFSIIIINAVLGVFQESKAEKSLDALKKLSAPTAFVIRDGKLMEIPASDLVPGDIIELNTGSFIPADARLLSAINLKVDESSLTGESLPATKKAELVLSPDTPLGDQKNMVFSSGIVTYGRGMAIVTNTGMNTQVGQIATLILTDETPDTPLQVRMAKTGKILGLLSLGICIILFLLGTFQGRAVFDMFMTSVSLAVAAIPEGLPAVITVMLSLGVERMAKRNAIIRKLPAVEALGSATVICSDKTGTLTKNEMTVIQLVSPSGKESLDGPFAKKLFIPAILCNNTTYASDSEFFGEPTEKALVIAGIPLGLLKPKLDALYPRIAEIPFDSEKKRMSTLHRTNGSSYLACVKGAPDILLSSCSEYEENGNRHPMTDVKRRTFLHQNERMAKEGLRVLAIAKKEVLSPRQSYETGLTFLGLVGMIDPPREEVKEAVRKCKSAGIRPVMITGDHAITASTIARQIGIEDKKDSTNTTLTGIQLEKMSDTELIQSITHTNVFARVSPAHKVRIVKAFQAKGELVAMTGDGVNDAPALKAADIGCAMGKGGTDVARDASDIILADDNFATIVSAVEEGRGIYDNIKKSIHFLLSCNIGEIMTIFIGILFGLPSPLLAVQLLWVNLVTDSLPAIALGTEPPDKNIMNQKPHSPTESFFAGHLWSKIFLEGTMVGGLALLAFLLGARYGDVTLARTMSFCVLSLTQLFHAFNLRSEHSLFQIGFFRNMRLIVAFLICACLQISVIMLPPLASLFKVTSLSLLQWMIVFLLAAFPVPIMELQKFYHNKEK